MFAFTNSIIFCAIAAAFVVGGVIIDQCLFGLKFEDVMLTFNCVIFGAQSVGQGKWVKSLEVLKQILTISISSF